MKSLVYRITILALLATVYQNSFAHAGGKNKTTIVTPEEDYYDVQYVKLEINADNTSTAIVGHTTTIANVIVSSMNMYAFELSAQLTIDSVKMNGVMMNVSSNDSIRMVSLSTPLPQNTTFTAEVWYHGQPSGGTNFFTNGLLNQTDASIPVQVTHTVSAAVHSRDWWPCKQSLSDKIDSADIWVTVPMGLKVASNGLLKNVTLLANSFQRFEWSSRNPVDYYLLSFAIAPYDEYNYYMHFAGGDSMLIQNFIYQHPSILQNHKDELDSIEHIINHFSALFGKYPFHTEKAGICLAPLQGGMENQTLVTVGSLDILLIAHELSHQWWGDHVTCHSLTDMWLNEGFATYTEHLYLEHFYGAAAALAKRTQMFNNVMSAQGGTVWVNDTTDEYRIYNGRLTYNKGAALAHMLRYMIHDDAKYFQILTAYQQQFANATATTDDLKNLAAQISGVALDTFFQQWYKGQGYPVYSAKWYQAANGDVRIQLSHTTSAPSSVSVFKLPIEIKLASPQGDTVIRVSNTMSSEVYNLNWSKTMTGMSIDPDNHIVNKTGSIVNDPILSVGNAEKYNIRVYPNPAADSWFVANLPVRAHISLLDMSGKMLWNTTNEEKNIIIPCAHLAHGIYLLHIEEKNKTAVNYYLTR